MYTGTFGAQQAERLLWRAGFGPRSGEAGRFAKLGLDGAVDSLLNPPAYAALLGIPYAAAVKLAPTELAKRLDIVLDTTQQLMRVVPERHLNWRPPERNRTLRNLGYHVFRLEAKEGLDGEGLARIRNQIRDILFRQKYDARQEAWLKEIKQRAIIEVRM